MYNLIGNMKQRYHCYRYYYY
ncbi:MAG: hypothetical protein RL385_4584, partial [Pseudomonadota bacterium]